MEADPSSGASVDRRATLLIGDILDAVDATVSNLREALAAQLDSSLREASFRRTYEQLRIRPSRIPLDTGFSSLAHMESWLWFLCNGNWKVLEMVVASNNHCADEAAWRQQGGGRKRALSWRDSYLLYRMHQWVRGATTERLAFDFGVSIGTARECVRCWAAVEYTRLQAFGTPTVFENLGLRSTEDQWTIKFPNKVVIMHDTSDVTLLGCPSDHALARLVHNIYYHAYCLKVLIRPLSLCLIILCR
jgi:hypothetical protein